MTLEEMSYGLPESIARQAGAAVDPMGPVLRGLEPEWQERLEFRLVDALYDSCWDKTRLLRWATLMSPEFVCGG